VHSQKSRPSLNMGVKGQGHQGQKNEKVRHFSGAVFAGASCAVRQFCAGGKISAGCLVLLLLKTVEPNN